MQLALTLLMGCNWIPEEALDVDRDGVVRGVDCDDDDPTVGEPGQVFEDSDGDGFGDPTAPRAACRPGDDEVTNDLDCNDEEDTVHPDAVEVCNGDDDDCDGLIDDDDEIDGDSASLWLLDADGDGFPAADLSTAITACVPPIGYTAPTADADCDDRSEDTDGDGTPDGFLVNPAAQELCGDLIDNDCNGEVDEFGFDDAAFYPDVDGDDWPDTFTLVQRCNDGDDTFVLAADFDPAVDDTDCDPADPTRYPGAPETPYDGIDQDCAGDDDFDVDGDGFTPGAFESASPLPSGDCNDFDPDVNPSAAEVPYDGVDDNCIPGDDDDVDGDGFAATTAGGTDCDDTRPDVFPSAVDDPYDGIDSNCDGLDDFDADGDGFAATGSAGANPTDCNDADPDVYPGAPETYYDGVDADCQADSDYDQDGDGFVPTAFADLHGSALSVGDCDDENADVRPSANEACNGVDDDCDGMVDNPPAFDGAALTALVDADGDGFPSTIGVEVCAFTEGLIDPAAGLTTDCDDNDGSISPGASEVLDDGVDQDCSGADRLLCYRDFDGDGFGDGVVFVDGEDCGTEAPNDGDCDDSDPSISPGQIDWCDDIDQDCDGDPIGASAVFYADGTIAPLAGSSVDLTGVDEVSFCGGDWSVAFTPSTDGSHRLRAYLPTNLDTSIAGTTTATIQVEGLTLTGSDTAFDLTGEPDVQWSDVTLASGSRTAALRQTGGTFVAERLSAHGLGTTEPAFAFTGVEATIASGLIEAFSGPALFDAVARTELTLDDVEIDASEAPTLVNAEGSHFTIETSVFRGSTGRALTAVDTTYAITAATFTDLTADIGGAMYFTDSNGSMSTTGIGNCSAEKGGAIATTGGSIAVTGGRILTNAATESGGALWSSGFGAVSISDTTFQLNTADLGGAIAATEDITVLLLDSFVRENSASSGGGLYAEDSASLLVRGSDFESNTASVRGGALNLRNDGTMSVAFSTFEGNEAVGDGGAIHARFGNLDIDESTFTDNTGSSGGAVFAWSTVDIQRSVFENNSGSLGGALHIWDGRVNTSTFTGNNGLDGGAIYTPEGCGMTTATSISMFGNEFIGNTATGAGGAISHKTHWLFFSACAPAAGPPELSIWSTFIDNSAAVGGAIASGHGFSMGTSDFTGNTATEFGGAVYGGFEPPPAQGIVLCSPTGTLFADNTAPTGGAVFVTSNRSAESECGQTFEDNASPNGAALHVTGEFYGASAFTGNTGSADIVVSGSGLADFSTSTLVTVDVPDVPDSCMTSGPGVDCSGDVGCTACP